MKITNIVSVMSLRSQGRALLTISIWNFSIIRDIQGEKWCKDELAARYYLS